MENKLEDLEKKYEELGKEIEKLKREQGVFTSFKKWRAELGKNYYYLTDSGDVEEEAEDEWDYDDFRYRTGNYFSTRGKAEDMFFRLQTYLELKDLAFELNGGDRIDWNDYTQTKHYIYYQPKSDTLYSSDTVFSKRIGDIYSLDNEFLDKAIAKIGEERLKDLFRN